MTEATPTPNPPEPAETTPQQDYKEYNVNCRVHGIYPKDVLICAEEKPEFERMAIGYYIDLSPQGQVAQTLFDEVTTAAWQLRRLRLMETELCAGAASYTALLDDEVLQKKLDRLARHHTRIERTFNRCLKQLQDMKNERLDEQTEKFIDDLERRALPAPTPISGRTQSAPKPEPYVPMSSAEKAEIDRDLDEIGAKLREVDRLRNKEAA